MTEPSDVTVVRADGGRAFHQFLNLPYHIYRNDPNWVAPLLRDVKVMFDRGKHPFHQHSEVQAFIARRTGRCEGRIVAIHNRNHVEFQGEQVGFFGFFECVDDPTVAGALFDAASEWLRERDLVAMRGPASFSTNETAALLVDGFDRPPMIMMSYNPPYYVGLLESAGFRASKEMVAYWLDNNGPPDFLLKREERLSERLKVSLRTLRKEEFPAELDRVRHVYNAAWEQNWGFVPMTDAEIRFMAHELKLAIMRDPEQVVFAENELGEPIGFALWLMDYNQALIRARGRLFPFGIFKILRHVRKMDQCRVLTLGLVPEYRHQGIDNLLYMRIFREGTAKGVRGGEFGWILEDNLAMRKPLEKLGSVVYKRYRMYDRAV